jgi:hypothetical protein
MRRYLVMLRSITIFVFGQTPRSYGIARGRNLSDDENLRKAEVISDLETESKGTLVERER